MKKIFLFISLQVTACLVNVAFAQNYGFGTSEPLNRVHIVGNLLVTSPSYGTNTAPSSYETITMVNGNVHTIPESQLTGRFYDPGGPSGNYLDNLSTIAVLPGNYAYDIGIEFTIESMNLGTGDSLIIKTLPENSNTVVLAAGNGNNITGKWVFPGPAVYCIKFKSNADGNNGAGFSIKFRRLSLDETALNATPVLSGHAGNSMFFDIRKGSFSAGKINGTAQGKYAAAIGYITEATGDYSVAIGNGPAARGLSSTALGYVTSANGEYSTAMGDHSKAEGNFSTAMGNSTVANGTTSTAIGNGSIANGNYSTAMGDHTEANAVE